MTCCDAQRIEGIDSTGLICLLIAVAIAFVTALRSAIVDPILGRKHDPDPAEMVVAPVLETRMVSCGWNTCLESRPRVGKAVAVRMVRSLRTELGIEQ